MEVKLEACSDHKFYYSELREVFNLIQENPDNWDGETLTMASGFSLWLSKVSTCFFLMAYSTIFTLFRVLQTKVMDMGFCSLCVGDTVKALSRLTHFTNVFRSGAKL